MISITTKFLGPTNFRGSRIAATVSDHGSEVDRYARERGKTGRLIADWDHRENPEENHRRAALALAKRLGWDGEWVGGEAPGGAGWTFVRNLKHAPRFVIAAGEEG